MIDFSLRLKKLRALLDSLSCDVLLIEHPTDLYYLTGLELSAGRLLVSENDAVLIVDGRYFESCSRQTLYSLLLQNEKACGEWIMNRNFHSLGFDQNRTTYEVFLNLKLWAEKCKAEAFDLEIIPLAPFVQQLRLIKDEEEIACLRSAARLGYEGYEFIVSLLKEGIKESELAFELEFFWKKRGGNKLAFDPIIAFGANSSMPHYKTGQAMLQPNQHVLIDIGVVLNHYHSDMTRVVYFGEPQKNIIEIYEIVEEAKKRALALCKPGSLIGELDKTAREWIASKGYGEYFTHSLGHGVGLEIHETPIVRATGPFSSVPLQKGMVLTIEPGIYLPAIGGVRLEDTILITEHGYENLTV